MPPNSARCSGLSGKSWTNPSRNANACWWYFSAAAMSLSFFSSMASELYVLANRLRVSACFESVSRMLWHNATVSS